MKVGLLIYGRLETLSGGYLYDRQLVDYLRSQGDRVDLISIPWRSYPRHLADNFSPSLLERLRKLHVDVLLEDELNHPSLFRLNQRIKRELTCPVVSIVHHLRCSEHRPAWENRLYSAIERRYLSTVDAFIYNSQTTRQTVESLLGESRPCVVAYPAGSHLECTLDPSQITARLRTPGPVRLLFIGNLIPRKGLHVLLKALALIHEENWSLTIAGSEEVNPAYAAGLHRQVARLNLSERVSFAGPLPEPDLLERLEHSHVLVGPSFYEGFGIVYLEGMAFGLPAVASLGGAAGELIRPGENGMLVPPGDAHALAEALQRLITNPTELERMSLAARQTYETHPTWEDTGSKIRQFLSECINTGSTADGL